MLQAAIGDGLAFDPFAFEENGLAAPDVDVGRGEIAKALMVAAMIVVLDEGRDLAFEIAGQVVVFQQDAVLQRLMPAFDLALGLGMVGRTADVLHALAVQPCSEIGGNVGRTIVRQQSRPVNDGDVVEAGSRQGAIEGGCYLLGPHGRTEFPGDDETGEVVEHGGEIIPAPADDLEAGEVGLPQLVGRRGLVLELLGRLDDDVGGAGDQVVRFQQSIDRGLRDEVLFLIGEAHRQFAWAEFGQGERQVDDLVPDRLGYPVPDAIGPGAPVTERLRAAVPVAVVPSIKGRPRDAELLERPACRQMGGLDQPDDLDLLGCGVSHAWSPPSPAMLFFSRRFSRVRSATTSFNERLGLTAQVLDLVGRCGTRRVAREPLFAGVEELLGPAVIHRRRDPLAAAELGDALLAAQALQHDADLLFSRKMPARRTPDVFDDLLCRRFYRLGFLSHLRSLMATMIQKSSVPEYPRSVSQALTADSETSR